MKLFAFAIGARDRASSRWRVWDHVDWLHGQGHAVRIDSLSPRGLKRADLGFVARLIWRYPRWLYSFFWSDAVLVQESLVLWPAVLLKNLGKPRRLVFDFSDPIDRHGRGLMRRLRRMMFSIFVRRADAIVVENAAYLDLMDGHRHKSFHFYGPVDATGFREGVEQARIEASDQRPFRIGWTGSHGTYKFIEPLLPIIDEIARERDIEVVLVGIDSAKHECRSARVTTIKFDETADLRHAPTFDLGLFRLEDNEDALWRGAGKLFIYMAAGAPFAATDRGIASALMREADVGFQVGRESDWPSVLRRAIADDAARETMRQRGLSFAQNGISYERYRQELLAHLQGAA